MADDAVRLMPASLRLALEHHREALLRGLLEPMTDEDAPGHLPPWSGGKLDESVESSARNLIRLVDSSAPFGDVVRSFGTLAHFVADAGFPPGAAGRAGAVRYADFAAFCESRRERIPLVFYGHEDADLDRGDFRAFARREMERARSEYANVARAYETAGTPPDPSAFDDRSVPFAVASLSYSRTVTCIVRAWIAAWKLSHGDTSRTPYSGDPRPARGEGAR